MFVITEPAAEAIRALLAPDEGGVRISLADAHSNGSGPGLTLQPAAAPDIDDEVIETDDLQLYVEGEVLDMLEDKVLDAEDDGDGLRFSVHD